MTDFLYLPEIVADPAEWERGVGRHPAFGAVLKAASDRYAALDEWTASAIHDATVAAGEDSGVTQIRKAQEPIRLAITGRSVGPPLWESLEALGRDRTIARLADALGRVSSDTQDR
jgi:glutamyl-tRNA synthetase